METMFYILCLLVTAALLLLSIYFIITLSDLECDYLNAMECCDKLNFWIIPRIVGVSILVLLCFIIGNWYLTVLNGIFLTFLIYQKKNSLKGQLGVFDPTEIHNMGQVRSSIQQCLFIVAWLLINFFLDMYLAILSLLDDDNMEALAMKNDELVSDTVVS